VIDRAVVVEAAVSAGDRGTRDWPWSRLALVGGARCEIQLVPRI